MINYLVGLPQDPPESDSEHDSAIVEEDYNSDISLQDYPVP